MGIGKCFPISDPDTGKPTIFKNGSWFCYGCNKHRKTIYYPHTGIIDGRCKKCGSEMVFKQE